MTKLNLFFPTPVWALQLENYKKINEEMYDYIKKHQSSDRWNKQKQYKRVAF